MKHVLLLLFLGITSPLLQAQGSDSADDAAYNSGWANGSNGGSGFANWDLFTNGTISQAGHFLGDSDIATGGRSWGLYANAGKQSNAVRPLGSNMIVGDILEVSMDNGSINTGGSVGISIRNSSNENLLEVYFKGGDANYYYNDNAGETSSTIGYTNTGLRISMTLTTLNTYSLTLTNIATSASQTITGSLTNPAGGQSINQIRLFNFNAGDSNNHFFNSLVFTRPMPVDFETIQINASQNGHLLSFSTATETNNAYFHIERSTDSRNWEKLGSIVGAGTTQEEQHYQFLDVAPVPGLNYYRIKQVDYDGSFSYSSIVSARWEGKIKVQLYPNPTDELLQISGLPDDEGPITIEIIDMAGRIVLRQNWTQSAINVAQLADGVYSLRILSAAGVMDNQRLFIH